MTSITAERFAIVPVYNAQYRAYQDRLHVRREDAEESALCGCDLMGARPAEADDAIKATECQRCRAAVNRAATLTAWNTTEHAAETARALEEDSDGGEWIPGKRRRQQNTETPRG